MVDWARQNARNLLLAWLPPVAWALLIWQLGSDAWNFGETSRLLGPLVDWLLPDLDHESRRLLLFWLRKLAHPGVYGVLTALSFHAASRTLPSDRWLPRAGLALAPALVLASADEWRQGFSALRTGSAKDVLLDIAGGLAVLLLALALERWLGRRLFAASVAGTRTASAAR